MRYILFCIALLGVVTLNAQYPTTGVKQRLGWQTTGDGLIFRGSGTPAYTPTGLNNAWTFVDTTTGTIYNYYAGAWNALSTGASMPFDSVSFNTTYTSQFGTGVMAYDPNNETVSVGIDGGVTLQLGQELLYPLVINKTGTLIKNGTLVMVDTVQLVQGDHVRVRPATNTGFTPSNYIMGVATSDIANDSTGLITWFGYVREVKHADIAETGRTLDVGDILYPSAVEAGRYTDTLPTQPSHHTTIALVVRKPTENNMTLLVRPWLAPRLSDLSDVNTSSAGGLSVLRYNTTTKRWEASGTAGIVAADTAAMLVPYAKDTDVALKLNIADTTSMLNAYARGSGTANQVAYWNGTRSLTGSTSMTFSSGNLNLLSGSKLVLGTVTTGAINIQRSQYSTDRLVDFTLNGNEQGYIYWSPGTSNSYNLGKNSSGNFTLTGTTGGLYYNGFTGFFGIGRTSPGYALDFATGDAIRLPIGTDAQRPTGTIGLFRMNNTNTNLEFHDGTSWRYPLQAASTTGRETAGEVLFADANGRATGSTSLTWSDANKTLGVNTNTTSGANIIVKNTQEPSRNTSWLPQQTFGADTVNWTKGTGWTFNGSVAVATAATGALTYTTLPDTIVSGRAYEVTYTLSGYSAGTVTVAVGNVSLALPAYNVTSNVVLLTPGNATGGFRFTTSTFTGNLDNVSVVEINNPAPIVFTGQDDNATTLYNPLRMPNIFAIAFGGGGSWTTGTRNNFFGKDAGRDNTSGIYNNFFGNEAGLKNTIGGSNNFFGNQAGTSNTIGGSNNFFGNLAGVNATTASNNNFFGNAAGSNTTTGSNNNFFGLNAGLANTIGIENNFFGTAAGTNNTTGSYNMFIGGSSGQRNTIGSNNIGIGYAAGYNLRTGGNNIFLGFFAGYNPTLADTMTGSDNTILGTSAARNIASTAAGNLVLGNSVSLPTGNGSNQVVIKNVIFATGASGTGTSIATGALVGINTNAPAYKLDVFGTDGIRIPSGTDAQRPTGAAGVVRYSSTSGALEYHTGSKWDTVATRNNLVTSEVHYIPITAYAIGDTVANGSSKAFFLVPSNLSGWCIDSYTVRAISGTGSATVQILDSGTGSFAQAISGVTTYTKDSNVPLTSGDYIQLDVSSVSGTLTGLSATLEIKKTCN